MLIRNAVVGDVPTMQELIAQYAAQGLMLPRSTRSLYENLFCFVVAVQEDHVVGVAGLHVLWSNLAEIRSLAVAPSAQGSGIGSLLVQRVLQRASELDVPHVLSLTYQVPFFTRLGFEIVDKQQLPHKIWKDCLFCKKYDHCDETAMIYYTQGAMAVYSEIAAKA